jgi:4-amino-4-deoxy-L-arabinose transferase
VTGVLAFIILLQKSQRDSIEKLIFYSIMLNIILISASVMFFSYNELKVNSITPLTSWLKENSLDDRQVMVYDRLLPSASFYLQKEIISINDGNRTLDREVQFEKNDDWKNNLYFLRHAEDRRRIEILLEKPSVLIYKGRLKPESNWLSEKFNK